MRESTKSYETNIKQLILVAMCLKQRHVDSPKNLTSELSIRKLLIYFCVSLSCQYFKASLILTWYLIKLPPANVLEPRLLLG